MGFLKKVKTFYILYGCNLYSIWILSPKPSIMEDALNQGGKAYGFVNVIQPLISIALPQWIPDQWTF